MTEKRFLSSQSVIEGLRDHYGISAVALARLPLGADQNAAVYKAEAREGSSYFVKVRPKSRERSIVLLALLQASGMQQLIPPVRTMRGALTQPLDAFTLTVYPFVEGRNGFCQTLTDDQWIDLGKALRRVHEVNVPRAIKRRMRKEIYSPKWREGVRALDAHLDEGRVADEAALNVRAFMKEHRGIIRRLVDRAESLSQKIRERSPEFVLCHSDIHGGNVLIDGKGSLFIVDWDEPIMAPRERDLMFIGGGIANVWNRPHEEALFYEGYGKIEINRALLAYYRHERIVEDIAEYGQALLMTAAGGGERVEMFKQFRAMFEPNGVIEIAFQTDEGLALYG